MQQWFYEMYGFYPLQMERGVFYMNQIKYELIPIVDNEPWADYETILNMVCMQHRLPAISIIKNKRQQYVSWYEGIQYVLVAGNHGPLTLAHIMALHETSMRQQPLDIIMMKQKWIARVDQMEYEILPWLPPTTPHFDELVVATYVGLGLAENAMMYISSIPAAALMTCLCNKRIDALDQWVILNPSHVIFDHPVRDIAELVKLNVISDNELFALIQDKKMSEPELSYLVARLLYPFQLFDCIESLYTEERTEICLDLQEFEEGTKHIIDLVRQLLIRYSLRPIEWVLM